MKLCSRQGYIQLMCVTQSARLGGIIGISFPFSIHEGMLLPHWGDSNEYTQYTIFNIKKKITLNYLKSASLAFFSKDLKNEFETAVENEPSVFEPLKFYCNCKLISLLAIKHMMKIPHLNHINDTCLLKG